MSIEVVKILRLVDIKSWTPSKVLDQKVLINSSSYLQSGFVCGTSHTRHDVF